MLDAVIALVDFNPLPSCEGRRNRASVKDTIRKFQSTPLMRGETRRRNASRQKGRISIHSPHARGDARGWMMYRCRFLFQSTPLMRGETAVSEIAAGVDLFQSTPLMRGETAATGWTWCILTYFNPLPSCEGRPDYIRSIARNFIFQSTPLMRGETLGRVPVFFFLRISIHSPHARGDSINL